MKPAPSVRPSVSLSDKVLILPIIRFFRFFCIKLAFYKRFKVTKPDFRKKKLFGPKMAKNGQNLAQNEVFGHFLEIASLVFANFAYGDRQA